MDTFGAVEFGQEDINDRLDFGVPIAIHYLFASYNPVIQLSASVTSGDNLELDNDEDNQ
jgi:hypothetical protein